MMLRKREREERENYLKMVAKPLFPHVAALCASGPVKVREISMKDGVRLKYLRVGVCMCNVLCVNA